MPCYNPLKAWVVLDEVRASGKSYITFKKDESVGNRPILLPCGQCIGCRLERSRQWAIRCIHEASLFENNCFLTLTFNDDFLSDNGSLVKADFQKFMKRLRKRFSGIQGVPDDKGKIIFPIRYFHCGEYGTEFKRPHHHACLFNFDFPDKLLYSDKNGIKLYSSQALSELWPFGFALIGDVTFESAAYVARYCLKKEYANKYDPDKLAKYYGDRIPEYTTMSRRPGIGANWLRSFWFDIKDGCVTIRGGIKCKLPAYYLSKLDLTDPAVVVKLKSEAEFDNLDNPDSTPARLIARRDIAVSKANCLKRGFECS